MTTRHRTNGSRRAGRSGSFMPVGTKATVKSLHPDLDEQALLAVKEWRFDPGTRDGKPVPVLVMIEMTFALRSNR